MMEKFWFHNLKVILKFSLQLLNQWKAFFVSDTGKHCVYQIDNSVTPAIGLYERSGEDDGPHTKAKISNWFSLRPNIHLRAFR